MNSELINLKTINLIGIVNNNVPKDENLNLLKQYFEKKSLETNLKNISEYKDLFKFENNIICIQPYDLSKKVLSQFEFKPMGFWVWDDSFPEIINQYEKYFAKYIQSLNFILKNSLIIYLFQLKKLDSIIILMIIKLKINQ